MSYDSSVLADTPLAFWTQGEPSGTTMTDSSGNGCNGDYTNGPTVAVAGIVPNDAATAVSYASASSQYGVVFSPAVVVGGTTGLAMEAVGQLASRTAATAYVVGRWYQAPQECRLDYFENGASSMWRFFFYDGTIIQEVDSVTYVGTIGIPVHVVVSHDFVGETVRFFVNGSLLGSAIDVSAFGTATRIGAGNATVGRGGSEYWDGKLQKVAYYGAPLLAARVSAHYGAGFGTVPVWVSPADTVPMGLTPVLVFTSPVSASPQHFELQLDTASSFNSGNLRDFNTSTSQLGWEYWDGSAWQPFPGTGLPANKSGNDVRYTVQSALSMTTWYRQVRAGV